MHLVSFIYTNLTFSLSFSLTLGNGVVIFFYLIETEILRIS